MRIGIFGGTFNPPHNTHIQIATVAKTALSLDKLLVVPCGQPTHKLCAVSKQHRLNMARLAFENIAEIDTFEVDSDKPSYSLDTVKHILSTYKGAQIFFVVGGDSIRDFDSWRCPQQLADLVTLVVAERGGVELDNAINHCKRKYGANIIKLDVDVTAYSSSDIRLKYQYGLPVTEVPLVVKQYIEQNNLLQEYRAMTDKLRNYLTPERFNHTFFVTKAGLELHSKCSDEQVFVACTLHDCAKYITPQQYAKYNYVNSDNLPPPVVHAFLGAIVANIDFGITDEVVLDAIRYHTTARPNMTELDMVVYVADKIEQSRPYPTQHLIKPTLTETFLATLKEAYQVCLDRQRATSPLTQQAIKYYEKILYNKENNDK